MADRIKYSVDLGSDVKRLVSYNSDVTFVDPSIRNKIKSLHSDDLVRVGKIISSLKIVSIDLINIDFLNKIFGVADGKNNTTE